MNSAARPNPLAGDAAIARKLLSLGFEREAARILRDHAGAPDADEAAALINRGDRGAAILRLDALLNPTATA